MSGSDGGKKRKLESKPTLICGFKKMKTDNCINEPARETGQERKASSTNTKNDDDSDSYFDFDIEDISGGRDSSGSAYPTAETSQGKEEMPKNVTNITDDITTTTTTTAITTDSAPVYDEYEEIQKMIKHGYNVLITGSAGTGKTVTIEKISEWIQSSFTNVQVVVCSTTGSGANNLKNGRTLHSWSGLGTGAMPCSWYCKSSSCFDAVTGGSDNITEDKRTILIIDEIYMLSVEYFEKMDAVFKKIAWNAGPMGNIQTIAVGDPAQLKPVDKNSSKYLFESSLFNICFPPEIAVTLRTNHRQKPGSKMHTICKAIYDDKVTDEILRMLSEITVSEAEATAWLPEDRPTICATNMECKTINDAHVKNIKREQYVYSPGYSELVRSVNKKTGEIGPWKHQEATAPSYISAVKDKRFSPTCLKVGMSAIVTTNISEGGVLSDLSNGMSVVIVGFLNKTALQPTRRRALGEIIHISPDDCTSVPLVSYHSRKHPNVPVRKAVNYSKLTEDIDKGSRKSVIEFMPLVPAKAYTVNASQGKTIHGRCVGKIDFFRNEHFIVLLTRMADFDDLRLFSQNGRIVRRRDLVVDAKVRSYITRLSTGLPFNTEKFKYITRSGNVFFLASFFGKTPRGLVPALSNRGVGDGFVKRIAVSLILLFCYSGGFYILGHDFHEHSGFGENAVSRTHAAIRYLNNRFYSGQLDDMDLCRTVFAECNSIVICQDFINKETFIRDESEFAMFLTYGYSRLDPLRTRHSLGNSTTNASSDLCRKETLEIFLLSTAMDLSIRKRCVLGEKFDFKTGKCAVCSSTSLHGTECYNQQNGEMLYVSLFLYAVTVLVAIVSIAANVARINNNVFCKSVEMDMRRKW